MFEFEKTVLITVSSTIASSMGQKNRNGSKEIEKGINEIKVGEKSEIRYDSNTQKSAK